jgi:hypothetical protein
MSKRQSALDKMANLESLPISQYELALPTRLRFEKLSIGAVYGAMFRLEKTKRHALRLNALLNKLNNQNQLTLEPVDADLRPTGWLMTLEMTDGIMDSIERAPTELVFRNAITGQRDATRLEQGILVAYDQGFEVPILKELTYLQNELVGAL